VSHPRIRARDVDEEKRVNSVAGRNCCKYRVGMNAASIEQHTLGFYFINSFIKRKMAEYAARLRVTNVDLVDSQS